MCAERFHEGGLRSLTGRFAGWAAAASLVLAGPAPLIAQTSNPYAERNVPFGSPLAGQASSPAESAATPSADLTAAQSTTNRVQPVEVTQPTRVATAERGATISDVETVRPAPLPSEFERYVERALGRSLPRFGADLLVPGSRDFATPATASIPPSYILNVGDRVSIGLTGSIEGNIDAEIDTDGRIFLPRIGPVRLAGVRYGDLQSVITRAASSQYRGFRVTATVTQLRGIRVYVTGFANSPGAYTVSSLSTMVNAVLAAGGPSPGGSFRSVRLMRNGRQISDFDLYDLVRGGDKSRDEVLQNQDVLYIPAVGEQVAVSGSVNAEAIYETRAGETLEAMLGYAGGVNALADKSRILLYRLSNLDTIGTQELSRAQAIATRAEGGDIIQVLSVGTIARPLERQSVLVRLEGEVNRPGNYYVRPNASLDEVMALAGGLTSRAFVYGTNFSRVSVRQQQREGFEEAIRQLEIGLAATPLTGDQSIDGATRASQIAAAQAVLARVRLAQPDGRVVLGVTPTSSALPNTLALENNDRILVPPRPTTVGVFGAVYRPASFIIDGSRPNTVRTYLELAGGPLRVGDKGEIFVVRANGSVLARRNGALSAPVIPGDVIFVPVRAERGSLFQKILQFSTIVFQLGLSTAAVVALTQ